MTLRFGHAFELRHFDIGAGQQVDDRSPGHAHHVGHDDKGHSDGGQRRAVEMLKERVCPTLTVESGIEPSEFDGEEKHQDIGNEKFRHGNRGECHGIDDAVKPGVAVKRCHAPKQEREGNGDAGGHGGQKEGVVKAGRNGGRDTRA